MRLRPFGLFFQLLNLTLEVLLQLAHLLDLLRVLAFQVEELLPHRLQFLVDQIDLAGFVVAFLGLEADRVDVSGGRRRRLGDRAGVAALDQVVQGASCFQELVLHLPGFQRIVCLVPCFGSRGLGAPSTRLTLVSPILMLEPLQYLRLDEFRLLGLLVKDLNLSRWTLVRLRTVQQDEVLSHPLVQFILRD